MAPTWVPRRRLCWLFTLATVMAGAVGGDGLTPGVGEEGVDGGGGIQAGGGGEKRADGPGASAWQLYPDLARAFHPVLSRWGVEHGGDELRDQERDRVWHQDQPLHIGLGIPAAALRIEATQDMMLAVATRALLEATSRNAWDLAPNTTAGDGAMLIAQLSFARCWNDSSQASIFPPSLLGLSPSSPFFSRGYAEGGTRGGHAAKGTRARGYAVDLLGASHTGAVWIKLLHADGWCSSVRLVVASAQISASAVHVRRGTAIEGGSWGAYSLLAVDEEAVIRLNPGEEREVSLATRCVDPSGLPPIGPVSLTPFIYTPYPPVPVIGGAAAADALLRAAREGEGALKRLLEQPWAPQVDGLSRWIDASPVMEASARGEWGALSTLVTVGRASVTSINEKGLTALHFAVRGGGFTASAPGEGREEEEARDRLVCVKELITYGADVNAKDSFGYTPLMYAARQVGGRGGKGGGGEARLEMMRALIQAGSDVGAADKDGNTVLHWACWGNGRGKRAAVEAVLGGCKKPRTDNSEGKVLENQGWGSSRAGFDSLDDGGEAGGGGGGGGGCDDSVVDLGNLLGETALMWCVRGDSPRRGDAILALLEAGADPNAASRGGDTAVMYGSESGVLEVVRLLVEWGGRGGRDGGGRTAGERCLGEREVCRQIRLMLGEGGLVMRGIKAAAGLIGGVARHLGGVL